MSGFRDSAEIKKFARTRRSFLRHAGLAQTHEQGVDLRHPEISEGLQSGDARIATSATRLAKKVAINYAISGKVRSAQIPGILGMAVAPLPTMHPSGEAWAAIGHPIAPDKLALAVGSSGSTFTDHGMRWDNSGKNGHTRRSAGRTRVRTHNQ